MAVESFDIIDGFSNAANTLSSCAINADCSAGTFASGATLLDRTPPRQALGYSYAYRPAEPMNMLGPSLPEGVIIRAWGGPDMCR